MKHGIDKYSRRNFLQLGITSGIAGASVGLLQSCDADRQSAENRLSLDPSLRDRLLTDSALALPITATFIDEISHDIPHQNWGESEWDLDFRYMKALGINTVILIRAGYRRFITYPSAYLMGKGCYHPGVDLLDMYLRLSEKYGMIFYFGLYDSGSYWDTGDLSHELEHNKYVIEEVWKNYGSRYKSFGGWYISGEISRKTKGAIATFEQLGKACKDVSNGLPTFISPWIDGKKAVMASSSSISRADAVSVQEHEDDWAEIFDGIKDVVDACAFQDGHIDYYELDAFFSVNKKLADRYGIACWTNAETFDRDMPIKFLPIKFDKLRLKLEAAKRAGYEKAITFEFSHFMSPQSAYAQAGHLYNRYQQYFKINQ